MKLTRPPKNRIVYLDVVRHLIHGDGEIKGLKHHTDIKRNLYAINVSVVICELKCRNQGFAQKPKTKNPSHVRGI